MPRKPKRTDLPDDVRLVEAMAAAVASAMDKHRAAAALVESAVSWPSAYTLAALGFEELGKACVCLSTLGRIDMLQEDVAQVVAEFWNMFNGPGAHIAKSQAAHLLLRLFASAAPLPGFEDANRELATAAEVTNDRKFRALYVDFDAAAGDAVLRPTDVGESEAREMTELLGAGLALVEAHPVLPVDAAEIAEYFRLMREGLDRDALAAILGEDPEAKVIEFAEQARAAALTDADAPPPMWRALFPGLPFGGEADEAGHTDPARP
jgi:AbiV family abortive infection protein